MKETSVLQAFYSCRYIVLSTFKESDMRRTDLSIAAVRANGLAAWAYVLKETDGIIKNRFLHSCTGFGMSCHVTAGLHALLEALRDLKARSLTAPKLAIWVSVPEVYFAMATSEAPLTDVQQLLRSGCIDELQHFREYEVKEYPAGEDDATEKLARWAWESGTLRSFPNRPTGRKSLPGMMGDRS